jgi:GNAT superfamily N-acetyltransferase
VSSPAPLPDGLAVRPVRDADASAVTALVAGVYGEYPGCVLDLPGVDADLAAPRSTIDAKRGDLWVVERGGSLVACCGWAPTEVGGAPAIELKRLYVAAGERGAGLGTWLVRQVEQVAAERGARAVELWSDTRFADAHRLYTRLGYERQPETRDLHDPSDTTEYRYLRRLPG